ncbi:NAD(P)-dependent oxidoreductase [Actinomadura craniellae]|uniref:NAD(P)-dependent oxidoreductase n=1 Tax=Actinomadura craniellae TaxID=2231787 RepID=A0A365H0W7_9ACTN|nr:NAD(P)-dependent oxidoreductase [Actinomadura craniellae]RAY12711.1 NAD(P)-dependent oxidoreductase [Actinomadura craniellae]
MGRVAVVGATGCVGRQICPAFARRGHEVLAIARHPARHIASYRFLPLDIAALEPEETARTLQAERVDVVVNAAGRWGPTEAEMVHSHGGLVERLVAAMDLLPGRPRVVHLGSVHEYGPVPAGTLIDESIAPNPSNAYARTKLAGSTAVLDATRAGRMDGVVLRAVNIYGPHPPQETFLAALLRKLHGATSGGVIEVSIAPARRDFVDVRDVAEAVVKAAAAPVVGRVVNIGRGEAMEMHELVTLLFSAAGLPLDMLKVRDEQVPNRGGGGDWTRADIRLAAELLGWRPEISPWESVRAMWDAFTY